MIATRGSLGGRGMLRRVVFLFVLTPLALLIVALAVANRELVTVSFDPFSSTNPAFVTQLPLYSLSFILIIAGVVLGGIAAWLKQRKWRRAARRLEAENRGLQAEVILLRRRADLGQRSSLPVPLDRTPQPMMRQPAA
jgi:uncharacterized integral membrane protein